MFVCGCDVGSRYGKVVILGNDKIIGVSIVQNSPDPCETAERALQAALEKGGISKEQIAYTVGTGYGNAEIPFAQEVVSEITCHGKGAHWLNAEIHTVIDIGGMDCKVILLNGEGDIENFAMNDKCAAGTGLFLEDIAGVLELDVESLGEISARGTKEVKITNQCSVFALSEVISLVALKVAVPDIVAGIHSGVANRVVSMLHRVGSQPEAILSGGVSKNSGIVREIEKKMGLKLFVAPEIDHQLLGALGAAVLAKRALERSKGVDKS